MIKKKNPSHLMSNGKVSDAKRGKLTHSLVPKEPYLDHDDKPGVTEAVTS